MMLQKYRAQGEVITTRSNKGASSSVREEPAATSQASSCPCSPSRAAAVDKPNELEDGFAAVSALAQSSFLHAHPGEVSSPKPSCTWLDAHCFTVMDQVTAIDWETDNPKATITGDKWADLPKVPIEQITYPDIDQPKPYSSDDWWDAFIDRGVIPEDSEAWNEERTLILEHPEYIENSRFFKDDKNMGLRVVNRDGQLLAFLSERLRADKRVVYEAVTAQGALSLPRKPEHIFSYASDSLRKNDAFVLLLLNTVSQRSELLASLDGEMRNKPELKKNLGLAERQNLMRRFGVFRCTDWPFLR